MAGQPLLALRGGGEKMSQSPGVGVLNQVQRTDGFWLGRAEQDTNIIRVHSAFMVVLLVELV